MTYLVANLINPGNFQLESGSNKNISQYQVAIKLPEDFTSAEISDLEQVLKAELMKKIDNSAIIINSTDNDLLTSQIEVKAQKSINFKALDLSHFFRFNNWVKIRSGVYDRYLKMNSSNFIGRIVDFFNDGKQDIFYILWSKETLNSVPTVKLQRLMTKKVSPFGTYVSTDLITPIVFYEEEVQIQEKQMEIFYTQIKNKYSTEFDGVFGENLDNSPSQLERIWELFFTQLISNNHPLKCFYGSAKEYQISSISGGDQKTGLWVELSFAEKNQIVPLCDLDGIKDNKDVGAYLAFYKSWANIFCY